MGRKVFWQGNMAVAMGAIDAGARFFSGYPITPSSEIAEVLSVELPKVGGKFMQMEDEIAGIAAAIGASVGGLKAITATSGPGFSLKQENLGLACIAEIPVVVVDMQRGGPSTGLPTKPLQGDVMQSRWGTHGDHPIIVLSPASVKDCYYLTIRAFNLSERFRTPVILLGDEVVAHMREGFELPEEGEIEIVSRKRPTVSPDEYLPYKAGEDDIPPMAAFGEGYRYHITGLTHDETGFPTNDPKKIDELNRRLYRKIYNYLGEIVEYEEEGLEGAKVVLLGYGSVSRSALSASRMLREGGLEVGYFRPITLWPFPEEEVKGIAERVDLIVVPEMNMGQLVLEVERVSCGRAKVLHYGRVDGEPISPLELVEFVKGVM